MTTLVAIAGATGTMGTLVAAVINELDDFELVASLVSTSRLEDMLAAQLLVDFTTPAESPRIVAFAIEHGLNVLVGTSGWSSDRIETLKKQISDVAGTDSGSGGTSPGGAIIVPNFSIGSVIATGLASVAARFFDSVEIVETHGPRKIDSPSGTAVRTAELIAEARNGQNPIQAPHLEQPARGQAVSGIPVHSRRVHGIVAQQEIVFGGTGETLSIRHDTYSPDSYRPGLIAGLRAVRAAHGVTVGLDKLIDLHAALARAAELAAPGAPFGPEAPSAAAESAPENRSGSTS